MKWTVAVIVQIEQFAEHILAMERQSGTQLLTDEERSFATTYVILCVLCSQENVSK